MQLSRRPSVPTRLLACTVALWTLHAIVLHSGAASRQQAPRYCPHGAVRPLQEVSAAAQQIKDAPFSSDRHDTFQSYVASSTLPFDADGVGLLLAAFTFSDEYVSAVKTLAKYTVGLSCVEVSRLLGQFTFSSDKMSALKALAPLTYDSDVWTSQQAVVNAFTFSSDQKKARKILEKTPRLSCVWGPMFERKVVFVVDVSGSMGQTFRFPNGAEQTRLQYVVSELDQIISEVLPLLAGRMFNVLKFAVNVNEWRHGLQPASAANLYQATRYIAGWPEVRSVVRFTPSQLAAATYGTSTRAALRAAYDTPGVEAVYFLSDGLPTPDQGPASSILSLASQLSSGKRVPTNTVFFCKGGAESASTKRQAAEFMMQLAASTGGVFRPID